MTFLTCTLVWYSEYFDTSIHLSIYLSFILSIHLSIYPSIYLSVYLSIYLSNLGADCPGQQHVGGGADIDEEQHPHGDRHGDEGTGTSIFHLQGISEKCTGA